MIGYVQLQSSHSVKMAVHIYLSQYLHPDANLDPLLYQAEYINSISVIFLPLYTSNISHVQVLCRYHKLLFL